MTTQQQQEVLRKIAGAAIESEKGTGVPARFTVAQCVLETGYLQYMPAGSNNCFGVKCPTGRTGVLAYSHEWFTDAQFNAFVEMGCGRCAVPDHTEPEKDTQGRTYYLVRDLFMQFASLGECFTYRATKLLSGPLYSKAMTQFRKDGSVRGLIESVAPIYSTSDRYAATVTQIAFSPAVDAALRAA